MNEQELKLKCLELATLANKTITIGADSVTGMQLKGTLALAQEYYQWVTSKEPVAPVEPVSND
jgi:hypothetical protein